MENIDNIRNAKPRKIKKQSSASSIAIIALSIMLGLSVIFGVTVAFFAANQEAAGTVTLGDPVNINITQGGASVSALTFSGTALPGTVYDQEIGISMPLATSDAVVRGKLTITNADGASTNVTGTTATGWVNGTDDYYYFNGKLSAGDSEAFITKITVPTSLTNIDANKTFTIAVLVEAIQWANGAASEVWTTAPVDWVTAYGSGV